MIIEISGRNYDVTDRIRTLINRKFEKLTKYFNDIIEVRAVLDVQKYRNICEIFVVGKDYDVKSIQEADTMEEAIRSTMDHLKRQAQKHHKKITERKGRGKVIEAARPDTWEVQVLEPGKLRARTRTPRIIKTSTLPIRPMSIEEAALQLDDSKNEFIVFRDLDTDKVTVIYKRRDNNFGMIAPEF